MKTTILPQDIRLVWNQQQAQTNETDNIQETVADDVDYKNNCHKYFSFKTLLHSASI